MGREAWFDDILGWRQDLRGVREMKGVVGFAVDRQQRDQCGEYDMREMRELKIFLLPTRFQNSFIFFFFLCARPIVAFAYATIGLGPIVAFANTTIGLFYFVFLFFVLDDIALLFFFFFFLFVCVCVLDL